MTAKASQEREKKQMRKPNENERRTMVACMEFIARQINDEMIFENWLIGGVADGDINYENFLFNSNDEINAIDDYYIEEENFKDLMALFLRLMARANKSGGLYCDDIVSR